MNTPSNKTHFAYAELMAKSASLVNGMTSEEILKAAKDQQARTGIKDPSDKGEVSIPGFGDGANRALQGLPENKSNLGESDKQHNLMSVTKPNGTGEGEYITPENGTAKDNAASQSLDKLAGISESLQASAAASAAAAALYGTKEAARVQADAQTETEAPAVPDKTVKPAPGKEPVKNMEEAAEKPASVNMPLSLTQDSDLLSKLASVGLLMIGTEDGQRAVRNVLEKEAGIKECRGFIATITDEMNEAVKQAAAMEQVQYQEKMAGYGKPQGMDAWKEAEGDRLWDLGLGHEQIDHALTNANYRKSNGGRNYVDLSPYKTPSGGWRGYKQYSQAQQANAAPAVSAADMAAMKEIANGAAQYPDGENPVPVAPSSWQDAARGITVADLAGVTRNDMNKYRRYTSARNMGSEMDRWKTMMASRGFNNVTNADYRTWKKSQTPAATPAANPAANPAAAPEATPAATPAAAPVAEKAASYTYNDFRVAEMAKQAHANWLSAIQTDFEKQAYATGADDGAAAAEAMAAGGDPEIAGSGDLTEEDLLGYLQQLVEAQQISPEEAEAILQNLAGQTEDGVQQDELLQALEAAVNNQEITPEQAAQIAQAYVAGGQEVAPGEEEAAAAAAAEDPVAAAAAEEAMGKTASVISELWNTQA